MEVIKINKRKYIPLGELCPKLKSAKWTKKLGDPVDTLVLDLGRILDEHELKREVSWLCWSSNTEKVFHTKLKVWMKKHTDKSEREIDLTIALSNLCYFPLGIEGLADGIIYFSNKDTK